MKPKFIRTEHSEYERSEWDAEAQKTPFRPIGDCVVIIPDKVREKTSGGIFLTNTTQDTLNTGATSGVIAALGEEAFRWDMNRTREIPEESRPKVGDRVIYTRYSGQVYFLDGQTWQVMADTCIGGIEVG